MTVIDPLDIIDQGCYLALRFMLRASVIPTDCLENVQGWYGFREGAEFYHPLQSVLIAEDAGPDGWLADVAKKLNVTPKWIVGFCDGFANAGEAYTDQDYIQGYLAAEELRQRRPGLVK